MELTFPLRVDVAKVVEVLRAWQNDADARRMRRLADQQTTAARVAVTRARWYNVPLLEQQARASLRYADWARIDAAFGPFHEKDFEGEYGPLFRQALRKP